MSEEVLLVTLAKDSRAPGTAPEARPSSPLLGQVHEVPPDLVETLAECWKRCRMAGLQRARGERWGRFAGLVSTVVTAAAGTTLWSALQSNTHLATEWMVSVVGLLVAVAVAIERSVTKSFQEDAKVMDGVVQTFHDLHVQLLTAASSSRLTGAAPSGELMDTAHKAVKDHVTLMSYERPTFDRARASVDADLRALGFYR